MTASAIDYDKLYKALVAEFLHSQSEALKNIQRLRKVVDAVIVCCNATPENFNAEAFDVRELVNELKTVERYIKKEAERIANRTP